MDGIVDDWSARNEACSGLAQRFNPCLAEPILAQSRIVVSSQACCPGRFIAHFKPEHEDECRTFEPMESQLLRYQLPVYFAERLIIIDLDDLDMTPGQGYVCY